MTSSLDRAVEAANLAYVAEATRQGFRPAETWIESQYSKDWMRAVILAALPHLGVDREALREIADEMRNRRVNNGKHTAPTLVAWAERLDAIIDNKQENSDAR